VLASPEGALLKPLFTRDPTGEMLGFSRLSDRVGSAHHGRVWSSRDGARALLIVQTRAVGSDIDAQQAACQAIRRAIPRDRGAVRLLMSGPPVFAVASRAMIKGE